MIRFMNKTDLAFALRGLNKDIGEEAAAWYGENLRWLPACWEPHRAVYEARYNARLCGRKEALATEAA